MLEFVSDDRGYTAWLTAHPTGFVLNTYANASAEYQILHRASCRTISRPLAPGQSWTINYRKICDDRRDIVEAWVRGRGGADAQACRICLPGDPARRRIPAAGSRASSKRSPEPIQFEGTSVRFVIDPISPANGPRVVIDGAQWLAETFFRRDPSAIRPEGSYDSWIESTGENADLQNRIVDADVTAVNRTMAARTGHARWVGLVDAGTLPELRAIDPAWDLLDLSSDDWTRLDVRGLLHQLFAKVRRPGVGIAVATKVLHIKRPRLIPVLDSLVLAQIGSRGSGDVATWVSATERVREIGRANRDALEEIAAHLRSTSLPVRSNVRIMDALLWLSHPAAGMQLNAEPWERVLRPRRTTEEEA